MFEEFRPNKQQEILLNLIRHNSIERYKAANEVINEKSADSFLYHLFLMKKAFELIEIFQRMEIPYIKYINIELETCPPKDRNIILDNFAKSSVITPEEVEFLRKKFGL